MKILVIDGHGGRIGRQLCNGLCECFPEVELFVVSTNSVAVMAMSKGGAKNVATGENAVIVNARKANVIIEPGGYRHCQFSYERGLRENGGHCRQVLCCENPYPRRCNCAEKAKSYDEINLIRTIGLCRTNFPC